MSEPLETKTYSTNVYLDLFQRDKYLTIREGTINNLKTEGEKKFNLLKYKVRVGAIGDRLIILVLNLDMFKSL